jgi:protein SSXT
MSYTQNDEIREQLDPSTVTLNKLLAENANLIQTINEFQRKGRIHEAMKYQELLHKNLMYLSKEMEPSLVAELEENPPPLPQGPPQNSQQQQPVSVGPSSVPPPSSSSGGTSVASPSRQPHSISSSQQNGHLSPYSSGHGPSPHSMRNGHQMQQQQQQNLPPQEQPLPPQMPPYGMPNGYPYHMPPHQGTYMNGLPPGHLPPR